MAAIKPYTYIQCPCYDQSSQDRPSADATSPTSEQSQDDDDRTFDPRAPRSNFSLYPLEYLLYCDVCHQIRCPRCVLEEIVSYYCPSCLFEVPSSHLRSEGNRCNRSCFQCPICVGPLSVIETPPEPETLLTAENAIPASHHNSYVLACSYCNWSSSEIGVKFDKAQQLKQQLSKIRYGESWNDGKGRHTNTGDGEDGGESSPTKKTAEPDPPDNQKAHFAALKSFYQKQLSDSFPVPGGTIDQHSYSSPGSLARLMQLYTGNSLVHAAAKKKGGIMREALSPDEGLLTANLDETAAIAKIQSGGWEETASLEQREAQPDGNPHFQSDLWPIPTLLRTKRSKRCPECRHIISKPEAKVTNTRWRIRLVAGSYIPSISIRPLNPPTAAQLPSASSRASMLLPQPAASLLKPLTPIQYLLTFKNPIFETVKVTLATPAVTPGRFASKVTVLCPQFEIDANTDTEMYLDEVLNNSGSVSRSARREDESGVHQVEAGKVWEKGRNWVSIVVEIVPASLRLDPTPALLRQAGEPETDLSPLREDEDVLEIPMFVRVEWEAEPTQDQVGTTVGKEKEAKEKKELAYWCVLGVGRIAPA